MQQNQLSVTTCDGGNCPSKNNCHRYTDRKTKGDYIINAALWLRREAGASACDMYEPLKTVSTFKD